MTYTEAFEKKLCPNCGKKLYNIFQETDGTISFNQFHIIKFVHRYGDFCEDYIDLAAFADPNNQHYFKYLQALYKTVKPLGIEHAKIN